GAVGLDHGPAGLEQGPMQQRESRTADQSDQQQADQRVEGAGEEIAAEALKRQGHGQRSRSCTSRLRLFMITEISKSRPR
ncbi:MAG: hypothetical protein ACK56I_11195, partial [bacterium]